MLVHKCIFLFHYYKVFLILSIFSMYIFSRFCPNMSSYNFIQFIGKLHSATLYIFCKIILINRNFAITVIGILNDFRLHVIHKQYILIFPLFFIASKQLTFYFLICFIGKEFIFFSILYLTKIHLKMLYRYIFLRTRAN